MSYDDVLRQVIAQEPSTKLADLVRSLMVDDGYRQVARVMVRCDPAPDPQGLAITLSVRVDRNA
jgi:hypothetical protein